MTARTDRDAHAMLVEQTAYRLPQGSDLQRMRGDMARVGGDIEAAIKRKPPGMPRRQRYSAALQVTLLLVGLSLGLICAVWVVRAIARLWS